MKVFNKIKGQRGEDLSAAFLKKNGYKILCRNYRNKIGEIDIIAEKKNCIIFVEVKARSSAMFGLPSEAVDDKKQAKIRRVAEVFMLDKKYQNKEVCFDVIEVLDDEINHIENAF